MKKLFVFLSCFIISLTALCQNAKTQIAIIPEPVKVVENTGTFRLPKNVMIEAPDKAELKQTIAFLKQRLSKATGSYVTVSNKAPMAVIRLVLNTNPNAEIGNEGYLLTIT